MRDTLAGGAVASQEGRRRARQRDRTPFLLASASLSSAPGSRRARRIRAGQDLREQRRRRPRSAGEATWNREDLTQAPEDFSCADESAAGGE